MLSCKDFPVLSRLLASNEQWAQDVNALEPAFFATGAKGQAPKVLWIGCADSRVPESVVLACKPGEIFVHRNIANQFHPDDDSAASVLTYAVDVVGVEHVIIAGHTGCGGAAACLGAAQSLKATNSAPPTSTPLERWIAPLTDLVSSLEVANNGASAAQALPVIVEENVKMQVANLSSSPTIINAWTAGKKVYVHGWVYHIESGRVRDLGISRGPN